MKTFFFSAMSLSLLFVSCKRIEKEPAGKGGSATINAVLRHHDVYKNIINGKTFIKYNAQDASETYDDSVDCIYISGMPTAKFSQLKKGKYYLYGTGFDTSIRQNVKGGIPYEVTEEAELNITLPVTETHL